jgi:polyhydroxyalkanoate synthase
MDDREIRLADISAPLLAFGGAGDGIAPVGCVRPIVDLVTGVDDLRFEIVPGGHLGMLTGRSARGPPWRIIDAWIDAHSSPAADRATPEARTRSAATRKTAASRKGAATKRTAAAAPATARATKKATTKKAAAKKASVRSASKTAIGANPARRYGSAGSRTLAPKKR